MKVQPCPFLLKHALMHTNIAVRSFVFLMYWIVNVIFQIFIQVPVNDEMSSWSVDDVLKKLQEACFPWMSEEFELDTLGVFCEGS